MFSHMRISAIKEMEENDEIYDGIIDFNKIGEQMSFIYGFRILILALQIFIFSFMVGSAWLIIV